MMAPSRASFEDLVLFDRRIAGGVPGSVAGVDEAGRGALAGPVTAAAVICSPCEELRDVRDSKLLSEKTRERLYELILEKSTACSTGIVGHEEIDRINILRATLKAMKIAVEGLDERPSLVLVDGRHLPALAGRCEAIKGGDGLSFSIAAASIVAKVTRDRIMRERDGEYPDYGFMRNKGYGTEEHREAIGRIGRSPIHRRSFQVKV
jgi:ribonuclease HII